MSSGSVLFDVPGPAAVRRHRIIAIATIVGIVAIIAAVVWKFWVEEQFTAQNWEPFVTPSLMEVLAEGLFWTVVAAAMAIVLALVFGMIFGVGKLSDHWFVRWPAWLVVEFFRAVPLLLLIIFIWILQGTPIGVLFPLVAGLTLYNGAVLAEIIRAGIGAVPKGQSEAAYAVGMRKSQVMRIVLLPQAIRIMLPAMISQCIVALKDTSLGYAIVAPGLTYAGRGIWREFDNRLATALVLAALYIVLNLALSWLATKAEQRLNASERLGAAAERARENA